MAEETTVDDLNRLTKAGKTWATSVADQLESSATKVDELKYSATQFGMFLLAWNAYSKVPPFIQDRLKEGATAAEQIAAALATTATSLGNQQLEQELKTKALEDQLDTPLKTAGG